MKVLKFNDEESWLQARLGKITGSSLGDITLKRGGGYKKGFYELIAERVEISDEEGVPSNPMDRGHYLEPKAMERFIVETGKEVDSSLVIWTRDDNENIAVSPDGFIGDSEAVEVKCLNSASHIEAWLTKEVPKEYEYQILQYFIVNSDLQKLYFVFYNPRIQAKDFFYYEIKRSSLTEKIDEYLEFEKQTLLEVDKIVSELTY